MNNTLQNSASKRVLVTGGSGFIGSHLVELLLTRGDHDALLDYRRKAPALRLAHPTEEHLAPILLAAGAAGTDPPRFPIDGFWFSAFSKRSVQFG